MQVGNCSESKQAAVFRLTIPNEGMQTRGISSSFLRYIFTSLLLYFAFHSYLSATIGSTFVARRAGT